HGHGRLDALLRLPIPTAVGASHGLGGRRPDHRRQRHRQDLYRGALADGRARWDPDRGRLAHVSRFDPAGLRWGAGRRQNPGGQAKSGGGLTVGGLISSVITSRSSSTIERGSPVNACAAPPPSVATKTASRSALVSVIVET